MPQIICMLRAVTHAGGSHDHTCISFSAEDMQVMGILQEQLSGVLQVPADKKKKRSPTVVETKKQDVSVPDVTELRDTPTLADAVPASQTAAGSTGMHTRRSTTASGAGAGGTTTIS